MERRPLWNTIESKEYCLVQKMEEEELLSNQLEYVLKNSLFYQEKFRDVDCNQRYDKLFLQSLPFTEKDELLRDQAIHPPFGSNICAAQSALQRVHKTSGTTGRPLLLTFTRQDIEHTHEAGARCFTASGLTPEHMVIHCLNFCMWAGGLTDNLSLEATGAQVIPYGVGNTRQLIEMIQLLKPQAIHCTPSYLAKLETILHDDFNLTPRDLGFTLGLFGAEGGLDDPNFRKKIESVWGFKAMNANYGMSDALSMFGAECQQQDGLHFMGQGIIYVEIIDTDSKSPLPVEKGVRGELVLTNLSKESQPLIRYRSKDIIEILSTDECSCGRRGFKFKVLGRADDMFVVKGINVFPNTIASVINKHLHSLTGEYAIEISKSTPVTQLKIRIEVRDVSVLEATMEILSKDFINTLGFHPELQLIPAGTLPRTEGKSKRVLPIL